MTAPKVNGRGPGTTPHEAAPEASESAREINRWRDATDEALIDHILERYHDLHREQLPELILYAQRVERVHGGNAHAPAGLAVVLDHLRDNLDEHMQKEEAILFPMINRGAAGLAVHPVSVMRREHDQHTAALAEIDRITNDLTLPQGACQTWSTLYRGLQALKQDLTEHLSLENEVLFARVEHAQGASQHG